MPDFLGLMKQAAQLQSKMQAMQAELDQIEVEGRQAGACSLSSDCEGGPQGHQNRRFPAQAFEKEILKTSWSRRTPTRDVRQRPCCRKR
jgi:hypothetical protein